jgi:putative DNA primase/helicase
VIAKDDQGQLWLIFKLVLAHTPIGTFDLRTGECKRHNPADYITKITKVSPQKGDCTVWRQHLNLVLGQDNDLVDYHQRLFGYCLTGFTKEKMFCFAHGEGNNGKSMTFNSVMAIMGDYAQSASIDTFTVLNNEQHPTALAALCGARLVIVSETEAGKMLKESTIKLLTGGDKIKARFMRQDEFEYQPQLTLIIFGNHKPSLRSVNEAIRSFGEKLMAESEELLHWMIEGASIWHEQGLNAPQSVLDATEKYLAEQDKFQMFCDDYLDFRDKAAFTSTKIILKCQHEWAEQQNEWKMREKDLIEVLERKGCRHSRMRIKTGRNPERGFVGVQISKGGLETGLAERMSEFASPRPHFN